LQSTRSTEGGSFGYYNKKETKVSFLCYFILRQTTSLFLFKKEKKKFIETIRVKRIRDQTTNSRIKKNINKVNLPNPSTDTYKGNPF